MTETTRETSTEVDSAAAVLAAVRSSRSVADAEEARLLQLAVSWVGMHSVDSIDQAATVWDRTYGDTGITVAGPGAPLVAEFSVAEFAAAVGLATESGKAYLGEAVELRHRLPRTWQRVRSGDLVAWRARRIARATILLSPEAASFVDRHVAPVAHRIRVSQLDRLVTEAIDRFLPEETERRRKAADRRPLLQHPDLPGHAGGHRGRVGHPRRRRCARPGRRGRRRRGYVEVTRLHRVA